MGHAGRGRDHVQSTLPGVFFGGDAAWGPKNIIWAVEHGHQAAISIHNYCQAHAGERTPAAGHEPDQPEDGHQRVELPQRLQPGSSRQKMQHVDLVQRFEELNIEVELGFNAEQTAREVQRCLNCDIETLSRAEVHRVRRLHRHLSAAVPHHCARGRGGRTCARSLSAPAINLDQALYASEPLPQTARLMLKDEDLASTAGSARNAAPPRLGTCRNSISLISLCRNSPSCNQHICVTRVNDFAIKLANVNGTGSASANGLLMQAIFRMGIPVSGKNLFPSNIQGLPTWYEIRVNKDGYTARALDYDLMVAMNAQTYDARYSRSACGRLCPVRLDLAAGPGAHRDGCDLSRRASGARCATSTSPSRASAS